MCIKTSVLFFFHSKQFSLYPQGDRMTLQCTQSLTFYLSLFARGNFYLWACSLCACGTVYWNGYTYERSREKEGMNVCVCDWTCKIGGLCECVMWLWDHFEPGGRWPTVNNISVPSLWPHRLCACAGLPLKNRGCIGPWGWISLSEAALLLLTPSLFLSCPAPSGLSFLSPSLSSDLLISSQVFFTSFHPISGFICAVLLSYSCFYFLAYMWVFLEQREL